MAEKKKNASESLDNKKLFSGQQALLRKKEGRKQPTGGAVGKDGDVDALEKFGDVRLGRALVNLRLPGLRRKHSVERVLVGGSLRNNRQN